MRSRIRQMHPLKRIALLVLELPFLMHHRHRFLLSIRQTEWPILRFVFGELLLPRSLEINGVAQKRAR